MRVSIFRIWIWTLCVVPVVVNRIKITAFNCSCLLFFVLCFVAWIRAYVRFDNGCICRFLIIICAHLRAYCNEFNIRRQHRRSGIGDCVQENYFNKALFRYFTFIEVFTSATIIASRIATMQNDDRFFVFVRWASCKHTDIYYAWAWCMETGITYTQRLNPMQRGRSERRTERKLNN